MMLMDCSDIFLPVRFQSFQTADFDLSLTGIACENGSLPRHQPVCDGLPFRHVHGVMAYHSTRPLPLRYLFDDIPISQVDRL